MLVNCNVPYCVVLLVIGTPRVSRKPGKGNREFRSHSGDIVRRMWLSSFDYQLSRRHDSRNFVRRDTLIKSEVRAPQTFYRQIAANDFRSIALNR